MSIERVYGVVTEIINYPASKGGPAITIYLPTGTSKVLRPGKSISCQLKINNEVILIINPNRQTQITSSTCKSCSLKSSCNIYRAQTP